jgi:hypothetical protein
MSRKQGLQGVFAGSVIEIIPAKVWWNPVDKDEDQVLA